MTPPAPYPPPTNKQKTNRCYSTPTQHSESSLRAAVAEQRGAAGQRSLRVVASAAQAAQGVWRAHSQHSSCHPQCCPAWVAAMAQQGCSSRQRRRGGWCLGSARRSALPCSCRPCAVELASALAHDRQAVLARQVEPVWGMRARRRRRHLGGGHALSSSRSTLGGPALLVQPRVALRSSSPATMAGRLRVARGWTPTSARGRRRRRRRQQHWRLRRLLSSIKLYS